MREWKSSGRQSKSARDRSDVIFRSSFQRFEAQGCSETSLCQIGEDANLEAACIVHRSGYKCEYWQATIKRQSDDSAFRASLIATPVDPLLCHG